MLTLDTYYQNIEWRHDQIDESEPFEHKGSLLTYILLPKITIGLSDWWNITVEQYIGQRYMDWYRDEESKHHKKSGSHTDFHNAEGGYLGDAKINIKFLLFNTGRQQGPRLFIGSGFVIPSKNHLTKSPYLKDEDGNYYEHRHFSMSSGVYKANLNLQYFYKKNINPVFLGFSMNYDYPIKENMYGFSGSPNLEFSINTLFNENNLIGLPLILNCSISHSWEAYWESELAPNSKSSLIIPGFGIIGKLGKNSFSINIQKPIFLDMVLPESGGNLNQEADAYQISFNIRRILDLYIPWLYW